MDPPKIGEGVFGSSLGAENAVAPSARTGAHTARRPPRARGATALAANVGAGARAVRAIVSRWVAAGGGRRTGKRAGSRCANDAQVPLRPGPRTANRFRSGGEIPRAGGAPNPWPWRAARLPPWRWRTRGTPRAAARTACRDTRRAVATPAHARFRHLCGVTLVSRCTSTSLKARGPGPAQARRGCNDPSASPFRLSSPAGCSDGGRLGRERATASAREVRAVSTSTAALQPRPAMGGAALGGHAWVAVHAERASACHTSPHGPWLRLVPPGLPLGLLQTQRALARTRARPGASAAGARPTAAPSAAPARSDRGVARACARM